MTADVIYGAPAQDTEAYLSTLEEIAALGQEPDYRANVPAGTLLGETPIEGSDGGSVRYRKRQSMVRAGTRILPERMMLWNKVTQRGSLVPPTIATKRMMQGTRDFPPSAFTVRDPHFPPRLPIDEHCAICDAKRAQIGAPPRDFFDLYQLEAHKQLLHPREWATEQRQEEQQRRIEDRTEMRELITTIVAAMRPEMATFEDDEAITEAVVQAINNPAPAPRAAPRRRGGRPRRS